MQSVDYMTANPDLKYEKRLWPHFKYIAGLDEAGRGALAGPVAVGAVILPNDKTHLSPDFGRGARFQADDSARA